EAFAARRMRWQELAGIHDAVWIEDAPEARHEAEIGLAELERHARGLVESYTVLAGDAAAHGEAGAEELVVGQLGPLELAGFRVVVEGHRGEGAVSRVEDVGDDEAVAGADGLDFSHDLRQARARHDGVLQNPGRRHAPDRAG